MKTIEEKIREGRELAQEFFLLSELLKRDFERAIAVLEKHRVKK